MKLNPYGIYHFLMFNLGGFFVKYLNADRNCIYGKNTQFFLGGGVINEIGVKKNIELKDNVIIKGWLMTVGKGKIKIGSHTRIHPKTIIRAIFFSHLILIAIYHTCANSLFLGF